MSIRILPENEIKQAAASYTAPPLLFSNPKNLYQRRAARLRELAQDHPLADYLLFAAAIADAQLALLESMPIPQDPRLQALSGEQLANKPLDVKNWQRDPIWRKLLTALLEKLKPSANDQILTTIEWLEKAAFSHVEHTWNIKEFFCHILIIWRNFYFHIVFSSVSERYKFINSSACLCSEKRVTYFRPCSIMCCLFSG